MATNFASYQDEHPDDPPPAAESASNTRFSDNDWEAEEGGLPLSGDRRSQGPTSGSSGARGGFGNGLGADERSVDPYNTSLPMRLEIEAVAAYVGLPPAGGALLLMFEHKNDYVRFHAWQSSLVFTVLFILHIIFSFTRVVSLMLLMFDLVLIAFLSWHAYTDAETLERYELPWFGRLASSFVDSE